MARLTHLKMRPKTTKKVKARERRAMEKERASPKVIPKAKEKARKMTYGEGFKGNMRWSYGLCILLPQ